MANYSNSNQINVPEAREAMRNMKHEVANELGITLNQGYNGNISAKDAGHIGGNMVKNMLPVQPGSLTDLRLAHARQHRVTVKGRFIQGKLGQVEYVARLNI